jgi:hypothetical protein
MSIETTLANAEARAAEGRWKWHKQGCPQCSTAQRARKPTQMCPAGGGLYSERTAALGELIRQRELDKAPIPGQEMLFT